MSTQPFVMLPPDAIISDDNIRYSLLPGKLEGLQANILSVGRVHNAIEVEPTDKDGVYRLNKGHYRHAAVVALNKEGAGLLLPCMVVPAGVDRVVRMKEQISENFNRNDLTPIDIGMACKRLLEEGVSRTEVRSMFSRSGGRKGSKVQDASNSFINMMMSFLELPKAAQKKIHEGEMSVAEAYQAARILKKTPEKIDEVLAQWEKDLAEMKAAEAKDEEKYEAEVAKEAEAKKKAEDAKKELETLSVQVVESSKKVDELAKIETDTYASTKQLMTSKAEAETIKAAEAKLKEAQEATKAAIKDVETKKKEKEKLEAKLKSAAENAAERAKKLKEARDEAAKKQKKDKKAAPGGMIQKAAEKVGADVNHVPLKLNDIKKYTDNMALPGSFPKVQAIGKALQSCWAGILTDVQLYKELAKITGETKAK